MLDAIQSSLVPRLSVGVAGLRGCWKESLVSTVRACASSPWNSKAPVIFVNGRVTLHRQTTPLELNNSAMCEDDEFESALKYALEWTGNHGMSPKPEQVTAFRAVYNKKIPSLVSPLAQHDVLW